MNFVASEKQSVALLCCNYGIQQDGIGDYAHNFVENNKDLFVIKIFSSTCSTNNKLSRVVSLGMTIQVLKIIFSSVKFEKILLEYPFVEWNPIFLIAYLLLSVVVKLRGSVLIASIHEYDRVHFLRKIVINFICRCSDFILVSDERMKRHFLQYGKQVNIRAIPSNIQPSEFDVGKKAGLFIYFGLVNKSKAFDEMLEAWDVFNKARNEKLIICSSSDLSRIGEHKGVEIVSGANNEQIGQYFCEASYCILPIKPEISAVNATFKTACLFGCVSIGKFCDEYKGFDFVINVKDYSLNELVRAYESAVGDSRINIENGILRSKEYGFQYSPKIICRQTGELIYNLRKG